MQFRHTTVNRMLRLIARWGAVGSGVMLVVSLSASLTAAHAAGTLQGSAQVVGPATNPQTSGQPMTSGDSASDFKLKLPSDAACAGDSTNDEWRWQTYIVPSSTDPANLQFANQGPTSPATGANFKQALYTTTGSAVTNQQTADKTPPSTEGPILSIPDMDFAVWGPGDIGPGTYNVGIACTKGPASATQMDRFWNTQMTFTTAATGGGPAQVTWTAQSSASTSTTTSTTVAGATTTTTTTTTTPGATTTTTSTTSTTIAGGTATTAAGGATTATTAVAASSVSLSTSSGQRGSSVAVTASGYQPNSSAQVYFLSVPVLLATVNANGSGVVSATVTVPSNAAAGTHTIEVRGTSGAGAALTRSATFTVASTVARTGSDLRSPVRWGVALLVFGAAAAAFARPKPRAHGSRR